MPTQPTFTCATCDVQIDHHPVFHLGLAFCCAGCAADGPCMCSYDTEAEPTVDVVRAQASPIATVVLPPVAQPEPASADVSQAAPERGRRAADRRRRVADRPLVDVGR